MSTLAVILFVAVGSALAGFIVGTLSAIYWLLMGVRR